MTVRDAAFPTTIGYYPDVKIAASPVSHSIEYRPLPDGDGATFMTLDAMVDAVHGRIGPDYSGFRDPYIVKFANDLYDKTLGQHIRERVASLFNWVITNIAYEPHPINQQTLQDAKRTLELRKADCVSLSVLLATLLAALDYSLTSRFVAQWVDGEEASHVYVEVHMPDGEWLALDAVAKDQPMGWRQPTLDGGFEVAWEIF
jgi:transglutaminase-like putative cysteine protease